MDSATSKAALDALAAHTAAVAKLREDLTTQSTAVKRLRSELLKSAARSKLAEIMTGRVPLLSGALASETDDPRLNLPAIISRTGRLQLGDLGTVGSLLEGDGGERFDAHMAAHPVSAVLVCLGGGAAKAVKKEFDKKGLTYLDLDGCVDEEGYALIANHEQAACAFIKEQLAKAAPSKGSVLVHCHEGKNRSAALVVAYLMVEERMSLYEAVEQVWSRRPIVLSNDSFVDQLIDLAEREGLL